MKLNKNGFTLIELLAVIIILLIISIVAVPSISAAIERNKIKKLEAQKNIIASYGELYYERHKNDYKNKEEFCVDVSTLKLTAEETDDGKLNGSIKYNTNKFVYQDVTCSIQEH